MRISFISRSIFKLASGLALSGTLCAGILHEWDVGAPMGSDSSWIDPVGSKDLAMAASGGGATSVVFTPDTRVNLSRAYTATNANLNAGAGSGLPTASYTFEWWLYFNGSISPGEVIFETGGGANGLGLFTTANGLEFATASVTTDGDAVVELSLVGLDLTHYIQVIGVFDVSTGEITLEAKDVDGASQSLSEISTLPLGLGEGNGLSLFAGGNGNFGNTGGSIGGSAATGVSLPSSPDVFSGAIGLFRIWDGVEWVATAESYSQLINSAQRADDPRPNVIIVFTDDHGYADLGIQGHDPDLDALTPNIDRLGIEGVRFTNGYITSPQCVPSRAGLVSGQYQQRFGVDQNGKGPMLHSVVTIAERLRKAGYRTGMTGKWHLEPTSADTEWQNANGYSSFADVPSDVINSFRPSGQGYDEFADGRITNYWKNYEVDGGLGSEPLGTRGNESGHRLDIQSDFAVSFIERNAGRPFHFYLSYFAPHVPLTWVDRYEEPSFFPELPEQRRIALSMIKAMDDGIGRILSRLDALGIDDKTIIWFIGDNGAPLGYHEAGQIAETEASVAWDGSLNTPLIGEKGMLSEGGIRVPFLMRWPGTITPQVYDHPVISLDVGATAVELAGLGNVSELDGKNLIPHLDGSNLGAPHDYLYWRFWSQSAIRQGPWKYLVPSAESPPMLFNLSTVRGEEANLIGQYPEKAAELAAELAQWKQGLFRPGNLGPSLNNQERPWYSYHFGLGLGTEFNAPGNNEGWTSSQVNNQRVQAGKWKGAPSEGGFMTQNDFFVRGAAVDRLLIDLLAPQDGTLTLQWTHRGAVNYTPLRQLSVPVVGSTEVQWLAVPTGSRPEWINQTVTGIRLLFTSSDGVDNEISWIRASDDDYDDDGIPDLIDGMIDSDGDGLPNFEDGDSDNDSLPDISEGSEDSDGDLLPDHFDLDSDNDEQGDRIESLLGTSTTDPNEGLRASITMVDGNAQITAQPGVTSLNYNLKHSPTLAPGSWPTVDTRQPTSTGDVIFDYSPEPSATEGFFRVEVTELVSP
jgi:arylsulfatase A-like enzyme